MNATTSDVHDATYMNCRGVIDGTAAGLRPAAGLSSCGTLKPGKRADFVLLRRNPLDDITAVYEVDSVFRGGRQVTNSSGLCWVSADSP